MHASHQNICQCNFPQLSIICRKEEMVEVAGSDFLWYRTIFLGILRSSCSSSAVQSPLGVGG